MVAVRTDYSSNNNKKTKSVVYVWGSRNNITVSKPEGSCEKQVAMTFFFGLKDMMADRETLLRLNQKHTVTMTSFAPSPYK